MNPTQEYALSQPGPYRGILWHLQSVIAGAIPDVELKFK